MTRRRILLFPQPFSSCGADRCADEPVHQHGNPAGHVPGAIHIALGTVPDQMLELMVHIERGSERLESLPPGQVLRVRMPGDDWEGSHWSV